MENSNERKWFVYLGDHHEGPFNFEEIRSKMDAGGLTLTHYIWCDGMGDWKVLREVSEFATLIQTEPSSKFQVEDSRTRMTEDKGAPQPSRSFADNEVMNPFPEGRRSGSISLEISAANPINDSDKVEQIILTKPSEELSGKHPSVLEMNKAASAKSKKKGRPVLMFLVLLALGAGAYQWSVMQGQTPGGSFSSVSGSISGFSAEAVLRRFERTLDPVLVALVDRFPVLVKWISPIPKIDEITDSDNQILQSAARAILDEVGPQLAAVAAPTDLSKPEVIIATNLPGEVKFDLWLRGVRGKIVGVEELEVKSDVQMHRRMGRSQKLIPVGQTSLPKGEYVLYAMESPEQPTDVKDTLSKLKVQPTRGVIPDGLPKDRKILMRSSMFLGGKNDTAYLSEIREFRERKNLAAKAELQDLKDLSLTLQDLLKKTEGQYRTLSKVWKKAGSQKKWSDFDKKWQEEKAARWNPEKFKGDYFYAKLFEMTQASFQGLVEVHNQAKKILTSKKDPKLFEGEYAVVLSQAMNGIGALAKKIEDMAQMGPGEDGLPRKDGL